MNRSMTKELLALRAAVFRARQMLDGVRVRKPHLLVKETLARYLADAIITAEAADAALTAKHPAGTEPLTRHLFETAVDVMYLVTEPDPSNAAARTVVWNVLRWGRLWTLGEEVGQKNIDLKRPPEKKPLLNADEAIANFAQSLDADGEDGNIVRRMYDQMGARKRLQHWSGLNRTDLIRHVEERADEPHLEVLLSMWHALSTDSHPSPWANRIKVDVQEDGTVRFNPDPAIAGEKEVTEAASRTTVLVDLIRRWVARGYGE